MIIVRKKYFVSEASGLADRVICPEGVELVIIKDKKKEKDDLEFDDEIKKSLIRQERKLYGLV